MEAFSDGVIAILITIMVLELKVPQGNDLAALRPLGPVLLSYVLSFVYLGIYWNNHHHLLHAVRHVDGRVLWANLHLLFWLSLLPFVTHWTGETGFAAVPVAAYGGVLLLAGAAYWLLVRALIARERRGSVLASAIGPTSGNSRSSPYLVAIRWLVDRRIASALYAAATGCPRPHRRALAGRGVANRRPAAGGLPCHGAAVTCTAPGVVRVVPRDGLGRRVVSDPRSFSCTTPSWLTMKVMIPEAS
jgi:uncharacterized membrane protein